MENYVPHPEHIYKDHILIPKHTRKVMSKDNHQMFTKYNDHWMSTLLAYSTELTLEEYALKYCLKKCIDGVWIYVYQEDMLNDLRKSVDIISDIDDDVDWSLLPK